MPNQTTMVPIAGNYLTQPFSETIRQAMDLRTYTFQSEEIESGLTPAITMTDALRDRMNYVLYQDNIKALTSRNNSGAELLRNAIANQLPMQQLESHMSRDTLSMIRLLQDMQDNQAAINALATVADIETVVSKDSMGNAQNWIYEAAFEHIHRGDTIGHFKGRRSFQNFYVGIYDTKETEYLQKIASKVRSSGVTALNQEEKVTFEFLSRLGASISRPEDLMNLSADQIQLTDAAKESFATVDNFIRAVKGRQMLGDKQFAEGNKIARRLLGDEAVDKAIADGYRGLNDGIRKVADNLAEIIINQNSMITGWNIGFDVSNMMREIRNNPLAEAYLNKRLEMFGRHMPEGRLPDNLSLGSLASHAFDPFRDMLLLSDGQTSSSFLRNVYGDNYRDIVSGMNAYQFENIQQGMFKKTGLDIYKLVHHSAGGDVRQEAAFILDVNSPIRNVADALESSFTETVKQYEDEFTGLDGLLFQARDGGSMQSIHKYNQDVFAIVEGSNGNLYMSNGFMYDKAQQKLIQNNQFTPGGWSRNVTYQYAGGAYIKKDSEVAKMIAASNDTLIDQDLVRIDLKLAFLNDQQKASEIGQETRYLYISASNAGKVLGTHFDVIGRQEENGNVVLNQFGKTRAERYRRLSFNSLQDGQDLADIPRTINQQKILDRAERSFNKYSLQTNENALHMREIAKSGTFADNMRLSRRIAALQDATLQASRGDTQALSAILQDTGVNETAEAFVDRFMVTDKKTKVRAFSNAWISNTATIASVLEEDSLAEQIHRSAVTILNRQEFAGKLATNNYARNAMYQRMVKEAIEYHKTRFPVSKSASLSLAEARGATAKYVDDIGKYHVNVTDFVRGYRSERYVPGEVEQMIGNWMRIDLNNIHNTRAEILRVTGLSGRKNITAAQERNAVLSFADFMSRHQDLTSEERQLFKDMFNDTLADRGTGEIISGLNLAFRDIKMRRPGSGFAPELALHASQSHLTYKKAPPGFVGSQMEQAMQRAAQQEYEMIDNFKMRKDVVTSKLQELIYGHDLQGGIQTYNKYISGFDQATQAAARKIYQGHESAVNTLAKSLVGMLDETGIGISVDAGGAGKVMMHYGGANYNITDLIPKLRTNSVGGLSWMIGKNNTRYVAAAGLNIAEINGQLALTMSSSLDDAIRQAFIGKEGQFARRRLQQKILAGENPAESVEYYLKEILRPLRENSRMTGSTSGDWRHFMTAGTSQIFSEESLDKIIAKAGARTLDANQEDAIQTLRNYRDNLRAGRSAIIGEAESSALYKLMAGDNPLISPTIVGAPDIILDATAKQTSTEGVGVLLASAQNVSERQTDPGKMLETQLDNALYFRVNPTEQDRTILSGGNLKLGYGPQLATKGERALDTVTSGGITMTNRLRTGIVEADEQVKEQIYRMLVQKNNDDRTIANIFARQFVPYEGGGWINSRLWDTIQNASAWQAINLDLRPGQMKGMPDFMRRTGLQFKTLADGTQEFTGYGRGIYVKQGDQILQEYQKYFNDYRDIIAKQDSIYSMAYVTREGNQIVDADTLKRIVYGKLDEAGKSHTQDEFLAMADTLYDKKLIARRVFDEGDIKLGFDSEKHISVPGLRDIASYTTNSDERLLREILYSREFDDVVQTLGSDFREGRTLSADIYYDIARMDFKSPIFTKSQGDKIRNLIRSKSPNQNAEAWFFNAMDTARHKLSDQVNVLTHGGNVLGSSMSSVTSHGNVSKQIRAAIYYVERQMHQNLDTVNLTDEMRRQDMEKAAELINDLGVLTDVKDRKIGITVEADGGLTFSTNEYSINPDSIREIYRFNGKELAKDVSEQELTERSFQYLSAYRDTLELPGGKTEIFAHYGDVSAMLDPLDSAKGLKITDREIETFSNTLYDEEMLSRLKNSMGDAKYQAIFGKAGVDAESRMRTSVWGRYLDSFYRDTAFMRWEPNVLNAEKRLFDADLLSGYRKTKTMELVFGNDHFKGLGKDVNVSMDYANDLYEVASLQRAAEFNRGSTGLSVDDLLSDKGKASGGDYFKRVGIADAASARDNIRAAKADPYNIFTNNLLVDLEDSRLGLNSQTLNGRTQIALAGVDLVQNAEDAASTEFQRKFARLQNSYGELTRLHDEGYMHNAPEYLAELSRFNKIKDEVVRLQDDYAHNKVKSSVTNRVLSARMPASVNNKVLAFSTDSVGQDNFESLLRGKTFEGEDLVELYRNGKHRPNIAIIGEADMKRMGFDDSYFRNLAGTDNVEEVAKVREAWIQKASTEGLQGTVHRFPTDYWGSTMGVRIYFDKSVQGGTTRYDAITAAFLKADADGDYAQAAVSGVMHGGRFYDLDAATTLKPAKDATEEEIAAVQRTVERARALQQEHAAILNIQRYDTNKMVIAKEKYSQMANQTFRQYIDHAAPKDLDLVNEFVKKSTRVDLSGKLTPARTQMLTPDTRRQYISAFEQYRGAITDALDTLDLSKYTAGMDEDARKAFAENISIFRSGKNSEAVGALQSEIATNKSFRQDLYDALGSQRDKINVAFRDAASVGEAQLYALQRIARKGVGLADTPFTATGFLRMTAVMAPNGSILSNAENTAMIAMKELEKEQLLTVKKMTGDIAIKTTENLDKLNGYINRIMREGKNNESLKQEFVSFMTETARSPGTRYRAESVMADFAKAEGSTEISAEKLFGTAYDALVKSTNYADSIGQFEVLQRNMMDMSAAYKGRRLNSVRQQTETLAARVTNTIMQSNSVKDGMEEAAAHKQRLAEIQERGAQIIQKHRMQGQELVERVVRNYRPGKGLAIAALSLAGAAVFGGYAGGNPSTPAQQQAQTAQEQEPPPRTINMADPSLTASNRKQAGYVININAQTQKDKEYASRLITQAVTRNFQDTNVNVSMNVNQQPGNISGNDLMDYLKQALY